jgi:hypothetical protein
MVGKRFKPDRERDPIAELARPLLSLQIWGPVVCRVQGPDSPLARLGHGQHSQKVQSKAQELGVTLPQEPNTTQKSEHDRLSKLSGAQFDNQFVRAMVTDHKKDIAKYEKEAKSKGPLADFAKETLPTLEHHLQTAETLEKQK